MDRKNFRYLCQLSVLASCVVVLAAVSPLRGDGGDPKKGEFWYREAGCDGCHGKKGRGDGPSGATLNPKPANYCTSTKTPTDADKVRIITDGGAAVGRSRDMPSWGEALDKQAILDLIAYIHALCGK